MFILITGANDSGKSRCAEHIASEIPLRRIYAATMIPYGPDGEARRARHLRQRAGLGFLTVECPCDLGTVACSGGELVLLEDVSNLLANLAFSEKDPSAEENTERQILRLKERCRVLIAVTIGGLDGKDCDGVTKNYVAALNRVNAFLSGQADTVIEMRGGLPHLLKGECPWIG
jgi:adenosylcobinamide kinase/adenosylcobinamide-phosphate guanylyltransferase